MFKTVDGEKRKLEESEELLDQRRCNLVSTFVALFFACSLMALLEQHQP